MIKNRIIKGVALMYKGFFWYSPNEKKLISYKTECDRFGQELNVLEKSFDFDNENEVLSAWTSFPKEIKKFKPYNYYPRGKVYFDKGKAIITINPVLNRCEIIELIISSLLSRLRERRLLLLR